MFSRQRLAEPRVVDLRDVVTGMETMLQRLVGEDVQLVTELPCERSRVKIEPSHIEQVILNLVVNARDAMPTGGKLIIEAQNVMLDETGVLDERAFIQKPLTPTALATKIRALLDETPTKSIRPSG